MFSSLVEFFGTEKNFTHTKKRRSSSLQGSLPTILLTTTYIDFEPLSPLTTTDPINVPLTYHGHCKAYSSSLDSLSTSRTNSLASSVSSSSSSYGSPANPASSSLSDDDDGPLPLPFATPPPTTIISHSSMDQASCGDMNGADHQDREEKTHQLASAITLKSASQPAIATNIDAHIITKLPLFENFRHSLSLLVAPSFTSMPWSTPPLPAILPPAPTPTPTAPDIATTTTTAFTCDNVLFKEDCPITTTKPIHDHPHQQPMYTRALRENPDHLRMIVSEVNMMRVNKLISPLRPRAILLERTDPFIPSTPSPLRHTL